MQYIVAAVGDWNKDLYDQMVSGFPGEWHFVDCPEALNDLLAIGLNPRYIFFPHWRWIVPEKILNQFECVCFHMTDVPYGRGGSPLQNLIVRGHKETVLTALKMEKGLDTGPVYLKTPLRLEGKAEDIYRRAGELSWQMIQRLVEKERKAIPQQGEVINFTRRKPEQSEIPSALTLEEIYNYIRMLDAPGYPKAFIESHNYCLEFEDAELNGDEVVARVSIKIKD